MAMPSPPSDPSPPSSVHSTIQLDTQPPHEAPTGSSSGAHPFSRPCGKDPADGKTWIYPDRDSACLRARNRSKANSAFELREPVCARGRIVECGHSLVSNRSRRCHYCGDLNVLLHRQFDRVFFSTSSFSLELRRE
ncbi:uncharacterized protein G2W53_026184 [Senna tora]|uniref:Uncharacterized protein n=1 Tax=Senna tora TaxID=362788 RepID=A0A834WL04_9FABA|nr:uncharacterized protein G2W53_026184 [Senna tora]